MEDMDSAFITKIPNGVVVKDKNGDDVIYEVPPLIYKYIMELEERIRELQEKRAP